ncbi:hypothetical protein [Haloarcula salinisoli]|uniref:hypothetical protein n=1 Tax=Haloarcula salinisoli TaxID=2487746 RepID=UPI001C735967|nr:hypothetical protein [Halomicroarcula salinisoli]
MGQGKRDVSDKEILQAIQDINGPFVAAVEVADYFDHTRQWAHNRLMSLYEDGKLSRKKTSENSVVWWIEA